MPGIVYIHTVSYNRTKDNLRTRNFFFFLDSFNEMNKIKIPGKVENFKLDMRGVS